MLVSPRRPVTPEIGWVPCRLPKPTRHTIIFFPLLYTQVPLYINICFLRRTHKYSSVQIGFFSFAVHTSTAL